MLFRSADVATITATAGGIPTFRYVVLYNDTAAGDPLMLWWDYGVGGVTLNDGESLEVRFNNDPTDGTVYTDT